MAFELVTEPSKSSVISASIASHEKPQYVPHCGIEARAGSAHHDGLRMLSAPPPYRAKNQRHIKERKNPE